MNNHNPTDRHLIETISVKEFQQVLDPIQHARKVALDQVAYENAARGVKSLKILRFSTLLKEWSNGYSFEGVPRAGQI